MRMPKLRLNNGVEMPSLGFGTWELTPRQAAQSVADALRIGYRHIDTAKIYANETEVGRAVRDSGLARQDILVTTKLWTSDQGYESAIKALEASLERLGLDYVDLYLIHWPGHDPQRRADSWRALIEANKQGKAKSIGVSNYMVEHLNELFDSSSVVPAVNQIQFNPFVYGRQRELLEFCKLHGIIFEAYSPLARGRLKDPLLSDVGEKYGKTASQVAIRWALQHDSVPLPRSSQQAHILQNFEVFDFELSRGDMDKLDNLS
jgi:diketogulonate reductase-like aldo/keto reductase